MVLRSDGTVEAQIQFLKDTGRGRYVPYYQGITDQSAPDATAQAIWATCQHSGDTQALNFFGWHRMYLYFERVLRWAAADDTLRLPYWDYTDPAQVTLPAEFQSKVSTLYDARRDPDMNTGAATLRPGSTNVDALLLREPDYFRFEDQIESNVHGYVHCTVGLNLPSGSYGRRASRWKRSYLLFAPRQH
jgi:hypothetical protein